MCKQQFTYLGFVLSQGQWSLLPDRKQAIAGKTHRQLRRFLGMAGVCQIWILNYGLLVKPFSEALKGQDFEPLLGLHGAKKPLKQWKQSFLSLGFGTTGLKETFQIVCPWERRHKSQGVHSNSGEYPSIHCHDSITSPTDWFVKIPTNVFRKGQGEGQRAGVTLDHTPSGWKCHAQGIILTPEALLDTAAHV